MPTPRINYTTSIWHGQRFFTEHSPEDSIAYLRAHIAQLDKLKHSLAQITLSHPGPMEPGEYRDYVMELGERPDIAVLEGPCDDRLSYGCFENSYSIFRDQFDYYIFLEDDYAPVKDNFDSILVDLLNERPGGGYVCALASDHYGMLQEVIASSATGMACRKSLDMIWDRYGRLFKPNRYGHPPSYGVNQQDWSHAFTSLKLPLTDWRHRFRVVHWEASIGVVREFAPEQREYLFVPYQMLVYNPSIITTDPFTGEEHDR